MALESIGKGENGARNLKVWEPLNIVRKKTLGVDGNE
jgi:hypothetical protein